MRTVWMSREDFSLFHQDISPLEYQFFCSHSGAFKRMWHEQSRRFWLLFVDAFDFFLWSHGVMKDFPMTEEESRGYVDDIIRYIRGQFVDGRFTAAKALINDCVVVAQNRNCIALLEKAKNSQSPFVMKETREVFRQLFGPPTVKKTFMKVLCGLPVYVKFAGAAVSCLRRWMAADTIPSDRRLEEEYLSTVRMRTRDGGEEVLIGYNLELMRTVKSLQPPKSLSPSTSSSSSSSIISSSSLTSDRPKVYTTTISAIPVGKKIPSTTQQSLPLSTSCEEEGEEKKSRKEMKEEEGELKDGGKSKKKRKKKKRANEKVVIKEEKVVEEDEEDEKLENLENLTIVSKEKKEREKDSATITSCSPASSTDSGIGIGAEHVTVETPTRLQSESRLEKQEEEGEGVASGRGIEEKVDTRRRKLHTCAWCGLGETMAKTFKRCQRCRGLPNPNYYCSRDCQALHWKEHRLDHREDKTTSN